MKAYRTRIERWLADPVRGHLSKLDVAELCAELDQLKASLSTPVAFLHETERPGTLAPARSLKFTRMRSSALRVKVTALYRKL